MPRSLRRPNPNDEEAQQIVMDAYEQRRRFTRWLWTVLCHNCEGDGGTVGCWGDRWRSQKYFVGWRRGNSWRAHSGRHSWFRSRFWRQRFGFGRSSEGIPFYRGSGAAISIINQYGPISVKPAAGNQVVVTAILHSDRAEIDQSQSGNRVDILSLLFYEATPKPAGWITKSWCPPTPA